MKYLCLQVSNSAQLDISNNKVIKEYVYVHECSAMHVFEK